MKHLMKNTFIFIFSILFILLSIKSSYAEEKVKLLEIISTSNKTVELKFDKIIDENGKIKSDLEIYRNLKNTAKKDDIDTKKIILNLEGSIEVNTSYSLISISGIEGSIIFKTGNDILGKEIQNNDIDGDEQGIKSILIKKGNLLEINFLKNIDSSDFEFQLYKTIEIENIQKSKGLDNIKVLLKKDIKNNSEYLGTLTYLETSKLEKKEVEKGIYYFTTKELKIYDPSLDEESLEDTLMNALDNSQNLNNKEGELLEGENEIKEELKSASEDPENKEKTQLEKMALEQKETPDSGAETWILIFATFILNTLYFLSRRKKGIK